MARASDRGWRVGFDRHDAMTQMTQMTQFLHAGRIAGVLARLNMILHKKANVLAERRSH